MTCGIQANGIDLDSIFAPYTSLKAAQTNIKTNGGFDLNARFQAYNSGTKAATTHIIGRSGSDLADLFQKRP